MKEGNFQKSSFRSIKWLIVSLVAMQLFHALRSNGQSVSASEEPGVAHSTVTPNSTEASQEPDAAVSEHAKAVLIADACEPANFQTEVAPGTCKHGDKEQADFTDDYSKLLVNQVVGAWRFTSTGPFSYEDSKLRWLELETGDRLDLENVAGQTHTFTIAEELEGGYASSLNPIFENPQPAGECAQALPDGSLVPQRETATNQGVAAVTIALGPFAGSDVLPVGAAHWQCCVHSWMQMNNVVRDLTHKHGQD